MARPLRVEFSGACYHVIKRGNYRRGLFAGKGAAVAFERALGEAAGRFRWRIHAYVIMSNHFHLALELTEPNLSEGMKWLQGTWIRRYNAYRQIIGRPFQGRFKAVLVAPGHVFGQVCHYIHLNPVRARLRPPTEVAGYAWSSLPKFGAKDRPAWLAPGTVLLESGDLPDSASGWKKYLGYLEFLATDDTARKELVASRMSRGWCLGDRSFKTDMQAAAAEQGVDLARFGGLVPDEKKQKREEQWEKRLQAFAGRAKIDLQTLPTAKSHPSKTLLAAAMKAGEFGVEQLARGAAGDGKSRLREPVYPTQNARSERKSGNRSAAVKR